MSCRHPTDTLESFEQRNDPTGTNTLRKRYAQRLRKPFNELINEIKRGIRDNDNFGLDTLEPPDVALRPNQSKEAAFMQWLNARIDNDILETIDRDGNTFIRSAYARGLKDAENALQQEGIEIGDVDIQDVFNQGVHERTLRRLYTKNFEALEDVTDVMASQIREEISDGFARGINPNDMARNITDRVDKIGRTRATAIAQTETIDAYSDSTLNRFEDFGVRNVTIQAELLTAGDARVCPICQSLEGNTWTIQEARTGSVRLSEGDVSSFVPSNRSADSYIGEFPVKPPIHVNCRCRLLPSIQ